MSREHILVVEDDPDIANMLRLYFAGDTYSVAVTALGNKALDMCRKQMPSLIILDIMLPDTDGFSVFQHLRADPYTKHIPVIFLTQRDARTDQLTGLELGASDYITKPFDLHELKLRVRNLLQVTVQNAGRARISFKGRLLIVEDNMDIATILHTFFTEEGYQAEFVATGQAALDVCQQKLYDLIILDVELPDIDGYEICQHLRQNVRTVYTPIVFLTQRAGRRDRIRGLELGADDYVTKPFDIDELYLRVRNLIQQTTHLPLDLETMLPSPRIVEEELNGLTHYHAWLVYLIQLDNRSDMTKLARALSQLQARFMGRWGEHEFVLILDGQQATAAELRLRQLDLLLQLGRVEEDEFKGEEVGATAVIQAARRALVTVNQF